MIHKPLTAAHLNAIRSILIKDLAVQTAINPELKELLKGCTIDIQVVQLQDEEAKSHVNQYFPTEQWRSQQKATPEQVRASYKPKPTTLIEVRPLPAHSGKKTHYLKATLAGGQVMEVSQHKGIVAAYRAKAKLEKHGIAIDSILRAQLEAQGIYEDRDPT